MKRIIAASLALIILCSGCATAPYRYGSPEEYITGYPLPSGELQFSRSTPHGFLDASGWIWPGSLLSKLILWNYKVDSHKISPETEQKLRAYIEANQLHDVKVRLNQYEPRAEWVRTFRNKAVGAGWRYTLGFLSWLFYTILPGRFFGGDHYNPYSNTINIYSDVPAILLHEGGHGKDFAKRTFKGTYAFIYSYVPFFNLYPEGLATADALGYMRANEPRKEAGDGYKILYPAYGTYIGGDIGNWILFPWNYAVYFGAVIPGHIIGRIRAATLPEETVEKGHGRRGRRPSQRESAERGCSREGPRPRGPLFAGFSTASEDTIPPVEIVEEQVVVEVDESTDPASPVPR